MILIGQYDSPFARRVGIALTLYGLRFEHRPWSVFGDAGKIRTLNPLTRVPTLILPDDSVLTDSHAILDYLDSLVPEPEALFPRHEPDRRRALRIASLATGIADKAVSLFYEQRLHDAPSDLWLQRCTGQIDATLRLLETERAAQTTRWWFGNRLGHADIAVACVLRHLGEAHPALKVGTDHPALRAHCDQAEALSVFKAIAQPFLPPA